MKLYKYLPLGWLFLSFFIAGCCSKTESTNCAKARKNKIAYNAKLHQDVNSLIASEYVHYAMMSSNSYHDLNRTIFPLNQLGWQQVTLDGKPTNKPSFKGKISGVEYDVYRKMDTNKTVLVFRGTDSLLDTLFGNLSFGIAPGYKKSFKEFRKYKETHKDEDISVTGHSLGGGIALGISVRYGIDAIVFDSSPRIFDGLCDNHCKAKRVLIYQNNEFLEKVRKKWSKISEILTNEDIYITNCNFNENNNHRMDYLAKCLLKLGAKENYNLGNILNNLK